MSDTLTPTEAPAAPLLTTGQMEAMYSGLDKMQAALPADVAARVSQQLETSFDPDGDRAAFANVAYLADAYKRPTDEVAANLDAYREDYAKQVFGVSEAIDDKTFYGRVGQRFQKQREERTLIGETHGKLFDAFAKGEANWRIPFTQALAEMKGKPGFDPARLDVYRQLADQQWQEWQSAGQHFPAAVDAVGKYLNLWTNRTGTPEEQLAARATALAALKTVPENQQDAILGLARRTVTDTTGQADSGEKLTGRLEQGVGEFAQKALTGLGDLAVAIQSPQGPGAVLANQAARKTERKLDNALLGENDPYHGDSWLSEGVYGAAEGLPRMLAMFHPAGIAANLMAYTEEARGHFEDAGVDPVKANGLGVAAAIPLTALQAVTSKTAMGEAGTATLEAWMLKNISGKAGTDLVKGYAKNLLAQSAENTAILGTVTAGQRLTEPAVQAIGHMMDGTIPGVQWTGKDGELTRLVNATPETMTGMLPLILLGTGMGTLRNHAALKSTVQNEAALRAAGIKEPGIRDILKATTPEEAVTKLQEHWKDRKANPAAVETLNEVQAANEQPAGAVSLAPDGTYLVKDAEGNVVDQAATPEMAAKAAQEADGSNVIDFPSPEQLTAEDRAAMRAEDSAALEADRGQSLREWIKGKLTHPDAADAAGSMFAGDLREIYNDMAKQVKVERATKSKSADAAPRAAYTTQNFSEANAFFAKKGKSKNLEVLAQMANEAGFTEINSPNDLLEALKDMRKGKDMFAAASGDVSQAFGIAGGGGQIGALLHEQVAAARQVLREVQALPTFKGFNEVLNKWVGDTQIGIMHTAADVRGVVEALPDEMTRRAVGRWLDAGGDRAQLEAWAKGSDKLAAKKEYEAALKLTPEQVKAAEAIRDWFNQRFQKAVDAGLLDEKQFRETYLTQLIERPFVQGGADSKFGQQLNKNFKFSKERVFPNLFELERAGYDAKTTDVAEIMARYDSALNKAIFTRQLVKDLLATKNDAGEPLAVPLKGSLKEGEGTEPNFINNPRQTTVDLLQADIDKLQQEVAGLHEKLANTESQVEKTGIVDQIKGLREEIKALQEDQSPEDAKLYKSIDHPSLRKWWWMGKDKASGKEVFMEGDIGLHPDVRNQMENALGTSQLRQWYDSEGNALASIPKRVVKSLDVSNAFLKRNLLGGLSLFHAVHEYKRALGNRVAVKPWALPEIDPNDARVKLQVRTGLMLATPHDVTNLYNHQTGLGAAGSLVDQVPGVGKISKAVSEYTFSKLIPALKSEVWNHVYERNLETFKSELASGAATKEQIAYLTSHQMNARFGHMNLADLNRDPTLQHILQLTTLAPDFWESNLRNYGQDIKGMTGAKVGREPVVALAATAAALWLTSRVLNKALDDDWHLEEPFAVIADGRSYTMRNEAEDLVRMWTNMRGYVMGRLSPTSQAFEEWRSGTNWRGEKISAGEVFKNWVAKVFPMSLRFLPGIKQATDALESGGGRTVNVWQQFLGSLGIQVSRHSPLNAAYKVANDWKKAQGDKEDTGTYPVSKYQQLRYALEDGDQAKAKEELQKLQDAGMPLGKITEGFRSSLMGTWTGSKARDAEFKASLNEKDLAKVESAEAHRQHILELYLKLFDEQATN